MVWRPSDTCGSVSNSRSVGPVAWKCYIGYFRGYKKFQNCESVARSHEKAWEGEPFSAG